MEQQQMVNGGIQSVPQMAAPQIIYLDFDGETTSYNGEILTVDNVEVANSQLSTGRITAIASALNLRYASQNVTFVTEKPEHAGYSTIFIGKTSAFDQYGNFAGLAETVDSGNRIKNDNAFVMLDAESSDDAIISTISHEADHLLGTLNHGGSGLDAYAATLAGTVSSGLYVSGSSLYIMSGGTANRTSVYGYGYLHASSGGAANSTTATSGYVYASSGGLLNSTTINYSARIRVYSGGRASNTIVNYGGSAVVSYGGTANYTTVNSYAFMSVYGSANNNHINYSGSAYVYAGARASNTTVNSGGYMYIASGAVHRGTMSLNSGATVSASSGAVINFDISSRTTSADFIISNMARIFGAPTYTITVSSSQAYGSYRLAANAGSFSGSITVGTTSTNYATLAVNGYSSSYNGKYYSLTRNTSGLFLNITSGASSSTVTPKVYIYRSGTIVSSAGTITGAYISSGGYNSMYVSSGGTANSTFIGSYGYAWVRGGVANYTTISRGAAYISSGGTMNSTTVSSGGSVTVYNGGIARYNTAYGSGRLLLSGGTASGNTFNSDGFMYVYNSAYAVSNTINYFGDVYVYSGGVVDRTTVGSNGLFVLSSGAAASNTSVCSGAYFYLYSGAVHRGSMNITSGANISAFSGAVINFDLSSRTSSADFLINNLSLLSSVLTYTVTVSASQAYGSYRLAANAGSFSNTITVGTAATNYATLSVNGSASSYNGKYYSLTRNSSGLFLNITSGATSSTVTPKVYIYRSGTIVSSARTITGAYISSGGYNSMYVSSGGTANSTFIGYGGYVFLRGGVANSTTVSSGYIYASSGGTASNTTVYSSGRIRIYSGGSAYNTTASAYGEIHISSGGAASRNTASSNGRINVSGGTAISNTVNSYGYMYVFSGAANNNTINYMGDMYVYSGATASNTIINSNGLLYFSSGAKHTGSMTIASGAIVSAYSGATVNFDISNRTASSDFIINNLSLLCGTPNFTITVSSSQSTGSYRLAANAGSFSRTISVGTGTTTYGSLSVNGAALSYNNKYYSLTRNTSGLFLNISSGTTSSTVTPKVYIYSSGILTNSASIINSANLSAYGNNSMYVSSGGTANYTNVYSGGHVYVSGGVANSTYINYSGYVRVYSGGTANYTTASSGYIYASSGGLLNSTTASNYGRVRIYYGGSANHTTANSAGQIYVSSGGTARYNSVNYSGYMYISSGGTAISNTVNSYGNINVNGIATSNIVNYYGNLYLYSGGTATSNAINPGGFMYVSSGASAVYNTVSSGYMYVYGGVANSNTANYYGRIRIYSGSANSNFINSYGYLYVNGGTANRNTINYYGSMFVYSGGIAHDTTVSSGGYVYLSSGAKHSGSMYIASGGTVSAYSGAVINFDVSERTAASEFLINNLALIYGAPTYTITVSSTQAYGNYKLAANAGSFTGSITVGTGTTTFGTIATNGSALNYNSRYYSLIRNTSGLFLNISSGVSSSTVTPRVYIYRSGTLVSSGGVINGAYISSGGNNSMYISSGGTAGNTIVTSSGYMYIYNSGTANNTSLGYYGTIFVNSGGRANYTSITSGYMYISSGGSANSTTIRNCGCIRVSSGAFAGNTIASGGDFYVYNGGQANSSYICSAGYMRLSSGAAASNTSATAGYVYVYTGAAANNNIINSGARLRVYGGAVNSTTVNSYGQIHIYSAGTANSTTINSGGTMFVSSGTANNTVVNSAGYMYISSGGSANSTTINYYGDVYVSSGGVISNTAVNSYGLLLLSSGAKHYGSMTLSSGAIVSAYSGAQVNFDISARTASSGFLINNLALISGAPTYTVTVSASQAYGSYKLAANAGSFNGTITVGTSSTTFGSITTNGAALNYNSRYYSLVRNTSGLFLNISSAAAANTPVRIYSNGIQTSAGSIVNGVYISSGGNNSMFISSGGAANSATVSYYGHVYVSSGGVINHTAIRNAGYVRISSGAVANSTTISGGYLYISSGGVGSNTTICSSGRMRVYNGGTAFYTTASNYGEIHISNGGTVSDTTLGSYGRMYISSGGVHCGSMYIGSGAIVSADTGSEINFDVSDRTTTSEFLINNLAQISGAPTYSITVSANQALGTYKLAQNIGNFNASITVGNGTTTFGNLSINGSAVTNGDISYSLNRSGDNLTLTVSDTDASQGQQDAAYGVSWNIAGSSYLIEYSLDNFVSVIEIDTSNTEIDTLLLPGGTWYWRVKSDSLTTAPDEHTFIAAAPADTPVEVASDADGNTDLFFARTGGTWNNRYAAQHGGFLNGWSGTREKVLLRGKNIIEDIYSGSDDANILVLTDDSNGDVLFLDDVYSALGTQARLSNIDEIRAGAGDDIVDMTSPKFTCLGDGMTVYGGMGNDTIWANSGENTLFGDAGNDRIIGGDGNDSIIGGAGNDSLHGGGGNDIFCFGENWGSDTVEQLAGSEVILWFENGSLANWDASSLTYVDGNNSVTVTGVASGNVSLRFGSSPESAPAGAFEGSVSNRVFEPLSVIPR